MHIQQMRNITTQKQQIVFGIISAKLKEKKHQKHVCCMYVYNQAKRTFASFSFLFS